MASIVWTIKDLVRICQKWQENEFDGLIVFDGNRGLGKSTGGLKACLRFPQFKMNRDIIFSQEDLMKQLSQKKHGIILADEMINVTYNRDFFSETQKKIIKMLNMYRDSCNILIACIPNFQDLDKQFKSLVKLRINVIRRGVAVIHRKNPNSFSSDPWDTKLNEKIEKSFYKRGTFRPKYHKLTTFIGYLRYEKLTDNQEAIYKEIKERKRGHVFKIDDEEGSEQIADKKEIYEMVYDKLITGKINRQDVETICKIYSIKWSHILAAMNHRLRDNNIKTSFTKLLSGNDENEEGKVIHNNTDVKSDGLRPKV